MNDNFLRENNYPSPIFIVGAPRSGTSLLRNMLNRHPALGLCDETYYFYYVYSRRRAFGDIRELHARQRLVDRYLSTNRIKRLHLDLDSLSNALLRDGESYAVFFLILLQFYAREHGKLRCGEKTPQHVLYADTICRLFPQCKLIHMIRDPRDVVASLMRMPWASKSVTANARSWVRYTLGGSRVQNQDNYLLVQYEQLVKSPLFSLKEICTFIGEEYDPVVLDTEDNPRKSIPTDEWWFQRAKGPLNQDRIGVWREELSANQVALIEWITGSHMRRYGYVPVSEKLATGIKTASILDEFRQSLMQKISNWGRLWYYWFQPTQLAQEEAWIDSRSG